MLAAATIVQATSGFAFLGVGALAGFFREEFSLTDTETGLIITAVGLMPVFALIPVGRLLDRHGERGIVSAGALILAGGVGFAALAPSYALLLALLFVGGSGYASSQPGGSKAVAAWFSTHRRGLAMGIRQTGLPLGGAAAAAILPALAASAGWQRALTTAALVTAAGGVLFLAVYRRAALNGGNDYRVIQRLGQLVREPRFRPVLWVGLLMVGTQFCIVSFLMLFLRDDHSIPLTRAAWFLFAAQMAGVAGRIALAAWSDRLGSGRRLWPVLVSLVSVSSLAFVLPLLPDNSSEKALLVLAAVMGFFAFGWYGPWVVHVAETASLGSVGLTLGIAMTANQIGIAGAPPAFGLLLDLSGGYLVPWWFVSLVLLLGGARVYIAIRRGYG